jgi:hypothetical protein
MSHGSKELILKLAMNGVTAELHTLVVSMFRERVKGAHWVADKEKPCATIIPIPLLGIKSWPLISQPATLLTELLQFKWSKKNILEMVCESQTQLQMQHMLYAKYLTNVQKLAEFSIADGSFLVFTKIQLYEASIHIKRNFIVQDCFLHHLRELICKKINTNGKHL